MIIGAYMDLLLIEEILVVLISLLYMLYDIFNNRNVPSIVVYATIVIAIIMTLLNWNLYYIVESFVIAILIVIFGYFALYKAGSLGLGDVLEFAAISMILAVQSAPILSQNVQYGIPFIISILIGSGISALILVPLYYIPKAIKKIDHSILEDVTKSAKLKSITAGISYVVLIGVLVAVNFIGIWGVLLLSMLMLGSVFTILFETPMTKAMIINAKVSEIEEDDIIALNMLDKKTVKTIKKYVPDFGGLVTEKMINEIKKKEPHLRLPTYKNAIPFAVFIFIGCVISLLFGNLFLIVFR